MGSTVKAALPGKVLFSGWYGGYGKTIILLHDEGVAMQYANLKSSFVSCDEAISQGQEIGLSGNTGFSRKPGGLAFRLSGPRVQMVPAACGTATSLID